VGSVGQYSVGILPWMGNTRGTGTVTRNPQTSDLGMAVTDFANSNANSMAWDMWFDVGTWKICLVHRLGANQGIATFSIGGSSVGTIDTYSAGSGANIYDEITGIVITTPGLKEFKISNPTKNGSSADFYIYYNSVALIRTAGTSSIAGGIDTPGYTWQYLPWMGSKTNTLWSSRLQSNAQIGGGYLRTDTGAQNNEISWDIWLDVGTYKYAQIYNKNTDEGIYSVQLDGVEKGTIDAYAAAPANNAYTEITGITVSTAGVKNFKLKMATKNASSSAYNAYINSVAWIRTGA
jgi:hypothetical protein